jgi:hypothetical protein
MGRGQLYFKETALRRAIRAFIKEGLPVQGGRIDRNGAIEVTVGKAENSTLSTGNELDAWLKGQKHH